MGGESEGLKGLHQVLHKMARIQEVVPIGTITIFPGTPEKNGCQKETEGRDPIVRCLGETDNVMGNILGPNWIEAMAVDGEMIKAIIQAPYGMGGHVEFSGIEGTG